MSLTMVSTNASSENTSITPSLVFVPNSATILTMNSNEQFININTVSMLLLFSTATPFHQRQDHLIRSVIISSLSSNIVPFVIDVKSFYALWQNLTTAYAKQLRARVTSLRESLSNLKNALCALEIPVTFEELHKKLLDFEQNLIRSSFSSTVSVTTNLVVKPTLHNNRSRSNYASHQGNNLNPMNRHAFKKFSAQLIGQNTNKNCPRVTCQLCDKSDHHMK
ncbi:hypothetical protein H5410_047457 [Solanum commersonii]|uniref:Uncharacterized protein n=1 Tax=Solanum commersonii TaxID=4109 RepID=A0A9J5XHD0_SOLCO|nr:hypothetical protein H5410_047457 [Solanum commersonii]